MKLTNEQVLHIAALARLQVNEKEVAMYAEQLGSILGYVGELQKLDTKGVPEMQHSTAVANVWRQDEIMLCPSDTRDAAIAAFPGKTGDLLTVQAVFENRTEYPPRCHPERRPHRPKPRDLS